MHNVPYPLLCRRVDLNISTIDSRWELTTNQIHTKDRDDRMNSDTEYIKVKSKTENTEYRSWCEDH